MVRVFASYNDLMGLTVTVLSMYDFFSFLVAMFSLWYHLTEPEIISISMQKEFAVLNIFGL